MMFTGMAGTLSIIALTLGVLANLVGLFMLSRGVGKENGITTEKVSNMEKRIEKIERNTEEIGKQSVSQHEFTRHIGAMEKRFDKVESTADRTEGKVDQILIILASNKDKR